MLTLFTERKAIESMFNYLEDDKRSIKAQARADIENIEKRQTELLDRLQRLDNIEREAIDTEAVIKNLCNTTNTLGALLPDVSASDIINKAAKEIAANKEAAATLTPPADQQTKQLAAAARKQKVNEPAAKQPAATVKDNIALIRAILKERGPLSVNKLEKEFSKRSGRTYNNFSANFYSWRQQDPAIVKEYGKYIIKENRGQEKNETIEPQND